MRIIMRPYFLLFFLLAILLTGCPPSKETKKEENPPPASIKPNEPEIIIKVACLNLGRFNKRIEADDVDRFATIILRDTVDILILHGITRYPDLPDRVDVVEELANRAAMRKVFGETITVTGRQGGNAVFSTYPIVSNENLHYANLHSGNFEAALQAMIDCGAAQIVVIGTQLPENAMIDDQSVVAGTLSSFNNLYINHPIIIGGNLPRTEAMRTVASYNDARPGKNDDAPRIWYSNDGSIRPVSARAERTNFGPMTVVNFGIFKGGNR